MIFGWLFKRKRPAEPKRTCARCIHLCYNSAGGAECIEHWNRRCNPKTQVKYEERTNNNE